MSGDVAIANHALRLLKVQRIASLDQANTQAARALVDVWEPVLKRLLRKHNWNFAIERFEVSPDVDAPTYGFKYKYTLPPQILRLIEIEDGRDNAYKLEGNRLLTDKTPPLRGRIVSYVTDATRYDAHFRSYLAHELAEEIAEDAGASSTTVQRIQEAKKQIKSDAIEDDSFEDTEDNYLDEEDRDIYAARW